MKKIAKQLSQTFCLVASVAAQAQVHKLHFANPLVLTATNIPFNVSRVISTLNTKEGKWSNADQGTFLAYCGMQLSLSGRDLALKNDKLGEHYFGSIDLDCKGSGWGSRDFKAQYFRVLVTGIKNCVESETMIDGDYCRLSVVAFHRESDRSTANGDLLKQKVDKKDYLVVHSPSVLDRVKEDQVVPEGLDLGQIDGVFAFDLSIGVSGDSFYLTGQQDQTTLIKGSNYYLSPGTDFMQREAAQENVVVGSLETIEKTMTEIEAAADPKAELRAKSATLFSLLSKGLQETLALMSPVNYHRNEKRIRESEQSLFEMYKRIDPEVSDREKWLEQYKASVGNYDSISQYLLSHDRKSGRKERKEEKPKPREEEVYKGPIEGRIFLNEDGMPGYGENYLNDENGACGKGMGQCNRFILTLGEKSPYFSCRVKRHWENTVRRYCEVEVFKAGPGN